MKLYYLIFSGIIAALSSVVTQLVEYLKPDLFTLENVLIYAVIAIMASAAFSMFALLKAGNLYSQSESSIGSLSKSIPSKLEFFPFSDEYHGKSVNNEIRERFESSKKSIEVLDYNPIDEEQGYKRRSKGSKERTLYYKSLIDILSNGKSAEMAGQGVRYSRFMQLAESQFVSDFVDDDPIFENHCRAMIEVRKEHPLKASLYSIPIHYKGNVFLIDSKILIMQINVLHAENEKIGGGFLVIQDHETGIVKHFSDLFEELKSAGSLVKVSDLTA